MTGGALIAIERVVGDPPEWTLAALCAEIDPDIFHVEKGGTTRPAKAICARCDVRTECLAYAMGVEDDVSGRFGVFGGLSPSERRDLAKTDWSPGDPAPENAPFLPLVPTGSGRCPVCNRRYNDIGRHMGRKHPEYEAGAA